MSKVEGSLTSAIIAQSSLLEEVKGNQMQVPFLRKLVDELPEGKRPEFSFQDNVVY